MQDIKAIASQEAEKHAKSAMSVIFHDGDTELHLRETYMLAFNKCLKLLAGSDGDIEKHLRGTLKFPNAWINPGTIQAIKEYTAIHTAKMLGDRWIYTVDGMPERLPEHQVGDPVYDNSSITVYVSDYSDDVYNAYWDFSNNCWRHTLDDEILNDVVAWITKPQSHNK